MGVENLMNTTIGVETLSRWLASCPRSGEEPSVERAVQLDSKTSRECLYNASKTGLVHELVRTAVNIFRVATLHDTTSSMITSDLYCRGVDLVEFRRFDSDDVEDAKREVLQAMELATILG